MVLLLATAIVFAVVYIAYRWVDPLPPRHFAIAAGPPRAGYDEFARQYARILARYGVELEIRNSAGGVENFDLLRDPTSRVQAAITGFGFAHSNDADTLYSLGAIFDAPIFIFYKDAEPITLFAQFRGKRVSIGKPGTSQQYLMLEVLRVTDALNDSIKFLDFDFNESVEALLAEQIDVAAVPQIDLREPVRRAVNGPGIRLMSVAQAEAIAKIIPGLKHAVLSRGLISLSGDIPNVDIDLLALRNRVLVRSDLHPALQYLLLEAMREVHRPPGPFNRLGEFPAEQPNDLSLSPTAQAFYRSGPTFWQRYTSFWLASLLNRIVFFVIPVVLVFVPLIGLAPQIYRWVYVHRIHELHRALGQFERELARSTESSHFLEHQERIAEIASAVQSLKVPRAFEVDLQRLRIHLRMVQEDLSRMASANKVEL